MFTGGSKRPPKDQFALVRELFGLQKDEQISDVSFVENADFFGCSFKSQLP